MAPVVKLSDRRQAHALYADVDRCLRHRGTPSPNNYFIIGRNGSSRYRLYLCPESLFPQWQWQNQLILNSMIKSADGTLNPNDMIFYTCEHAEDIYTTIPRILHIVFKSHVADENLEQFYGAKVRFPFFSHEPPPFTIASVVGNGNKF